MPTVAAVPSRKQTLAEIRAAGLENAVEIGRRMRQAREADGLTAADVAAEMARVDERTVRTWEAGVTGTRMASQETVSRLERADVGSRKSGAHETVYVGPGVHLLYLYEKAVPSLAVGELTAGLYHDRDRVDEPLETRIQRDPSIDKDTKTALLNVLRLSRR